MCEYRIILSQGNAVTKRGDSMFSIEMKILICFLWSLIVFLCASLMMGEERKAQWFQKRTRYSFFNRRGIVSEVLHFGYPSTKEGYGIAALIMLLIGIVIYVVCIL